MWSVVIWGEGGGRGAGEGELLGRWERPRRRIGLPAPAPSHANGEPAARPERKRKDGTRAALEGKVQGRCDPGRSLTARLLLVVKVVELLRHRLRVLELGGVQEVHQHEQLLRGCGGLWCAVWGVCVSVCVRVFVCLCVCVCVCE